MAAPYLDLRHSFILCPDFCHSGKLALANDAVYKQPLSSSGIFAATPWQLYHKIPCLQILQNLLIECLLHQILYFPSLAVAQSTIIVCRKFQLCWRKTSTLRCEVPLLLAFLSID